MSRSVSDQELRELARQRYQDKMGFWQHLAIYVVVNGTLALAWAFSTDVDHPFFIWATVPWGIGLLIHFAMAYLMPGRKTARGQQAGHGEAAGRKKWFYRHLALYLVVNAVFVAVWAGTGAESDPVPWFIYPLGAWGIFVLWSFLEAFVFVKETQWRKTRIQREFERLKRAHG